LVRLEPGRTRTDKIKQTCYPGGIGQSGRTDTHPIGGCVRPESRPSSSSLKNLHPLGCLFWFFFRPVRPVVMGSKNRPRLVFVEVFTKERKMPNERGGRGQSRVPSKGLASPLAKNRKRLLVIVSPQAIHSVLAVLLYGSFRQGSLQCPCKGLSLSVASLARPTLGAIFPSK
jgi:hypothetical protein